MRLLNLDALKKGGCICIFSQLFVIRSSVIYSPLDPRRHELLLSMYACQFYLADTVRDRNLLATPYIYNFAASQAAGSRRLRIGYRPDIRLVDIRLAVNLFDAGGVE